MKFLAKPSSMLKFAFVFCAAFLALGTAQAQQANIGVISSPRLMAEAQQVKAVQLKLKQEFDKRATDLQDMEARIKAGQAKLEKDSAIMSDADRAKASRELNDTYKEYQRKQREFQEDYNQRYNEEVEGVLVKVRKIVKQIAEENKLDLIVQETSVAYSSPRVDITDKVLKALNQAK